MRLIDADALRKSFKKSPFFTGFYLCYARQLIDNAPTIEERKKGKWGDVFHHQGFNYHKCSNCHIAMKVSDYDNYCPNCGADMRKEDPWESD